MSSRTRSISLLGWAIVLSLLGRATPARAQEEDETAQASRKARGESTAATYHAGAFAGTYVQGDETGLLVDVGFGVESKGRSQRLKLTLDYEFDPFSSKTFNFAEDQDTAITRLVQRTHELKAGTRWRNSFTRWFRAGLGFTGTASWPELDRDQRWSLNLGPELRFGKASGLYATLTGDLFLRSYPNYFVADRRIDQQGASGELEIGYELKGIGTLGVGLESALTDYLNSRYDALSPTRVVIRARDSKSYLNRTAYILFSARPVRVLDVDFKYAYEINDSRDYDRRVAGVDERGAPLAKFIPDYYDYRRHRLGYAARLTSAPKFVLKHQAEVWVRDFATYEARTRDNVWTGEQRHDTGAELALEASYRLLGFKALNSKHAVYATAFGSQVLRRSNMRREVSLATNFTLTRLFAGFELREF